MSLRPCGCKAACTLRYTDSELLPAIPATWNVAHCNALLSQTSFVAAEPRANQMNNKNTEHNVRITSYLLCPGKIPRCKMCTTYFHLPCHGFSYSTLDGPFSLQAAPRGELVKADCAFLRTAYKDAANAVTAEASGHFARAALL